MLSSKLRSISLYKLSPDPAALCEMLYFYRQILSNKLYEWINDYRIINLSESSCLRERANLNEFACLSGVFTSLHVTKISWSSHMNAAKWILKSTQALRLQDNNVQSRILNYDHERAKKCPAELTKINIQGKQ